MATSQEREALLKVMDEIAEFTDRHIIHGEVARQFGLQKKHILAIERHIKRQKQQAEQSRQK